MRKFFPKPDTVDTRDYNIYYIISLACTFACILGLFLAPLLFFSESPKNTIFAIIPIVGALLVNYFNARGKLFIAILFLFWLTYLFSLAGTLTFGWNAGFQYYLLVQVAVLILYPYLGVKYLFSLCFISILTFLILYLTIETADSADFRLNFILHTLNAVNAITLLCASNLFFRTNAQHLINKFYNIASIDPLTGLNNRTSMKKKLLAHFEEVKADNQPSALILFNIDHFKRVNTKLGHTAGDNVLTQLAHILKTNCKETDIVARWGSDEFLLLGPYTLSKPATVLAERLRKHIAQHTFISHGNAIKLTLSCGVTNIRSDNSIESSLTQVATLISDAKRMGRNRTCVYSSDSNVQVE